MLEIPGIGAVERYEFDNWLRSQPIEVKVLGNIECRFVVEGYVEDDNKHDFHLAIENFLALEESVLKQAQDSIFAYYRDVSENSEPDDDWYVEIDRPDRVWQHLKLSTRPMITRRYYGDRLVYVSLDCYCQWEQEHGLQIVFKMGEYVNKVGAFDGHLTNADAYADDTLENVVYV
jgi:hypothetical protein